MRYARVLSGLALSVAIATPMTAAAQDDDRARILAADAAHALSEGRYAEALDGYRQAYALSQRAELLYNIGVAADWLRHDAEALEAFETFMAQVPEHARRQDVEARVAVLRESLAHRPATQSSHGGGPGTIAIVGATVLGAIGLAGVTAAIVGMAGSGCHETDSSGVCVEATQPAWLAVGLYGGLGLAAIAGAVIWLIVDSSSSGNSVQVGLAPNGLAVAGSFQ